MSFRTMDDGTLRIEVYEADSKVEVFTSFRKAERYI